MNDAAVDPRLSVFAGAVAIGSNDDWSAPGANATDPLVHAGVGAFPLQAGSRDAAWTASSLAEPKYTIHVPAEAGRSVLAEVYQRETDGRAQFANLSCRNVIEAGDHTLIAGFTLSGPGIRRVLVRAIGPGLKAFGIGEVAADPVLDLNSGGAVLASNDNWTQQSDAPEVTEAQRRAGAFAIEPGADAALVQELGPGSYTVTIRDRTRSGGEVLLEVYAIEP